MVIIETLVICDDCQDAYGGDDRDITAAQIRKIRKQHGWIQRGSKDYCDKCASKHQKRASKEQPQ